MKLSIIQAKANRLDRLIETLEAQTKWLVLEAPTDKRIKPHRLSSTCGCLLCYVKAMLEIVKE
jgi:hypothetical protein